MELLRGRGGGRGVRSGVGGGLSLGLMIPVGLKCRIIGEEEVEASRCLGFVDRLNS